MRIMIAEEVLVERTVKVQIRPALHADKCDACGVVFRMRGTSGGRTVAELSGRFEHCALDKEGRSLGNGFRATTCSFACAEDLFGEAWRNIKEYRVFAKVKGNFLVEAEVRIARAMDTLEIVRKEWEIAENDCPEGYVLRRP